MRLSLFITLLGAILPVIALPPANVFAGPSPQDSLADGKAVTAAPEPSVDWQQVTVFGDVGEIFGTAWNASYGQLQHTDTLTTLGLGAAVTWLVDDNDDAWLASLQGKEFLTSGLFDSLGDQSALALSAAPVVTWLVSSWTQDEKLRSFSLESLSAIVLTYTETEIITNAIPTHERPRNEAGDDATSFFDTAFRGKYSFPSGHLIGPFIVTMKAWDYYGWKVALVPAAVTGVSTVNRIADGSHYPSDIAAAAVLSLSAHFATRRETRDRNHGLHWGAAPVAGGGMMVTGSFDF